METTGKMDYRRLSVHSLSSWLGEIWNQSWYTESKERQKKEADHSRLVDSRVTKQRNLLRRLVLCSLKMSRSLHPPTRILSLHRGYYELGSVMYIVQMVSTTHCSLKAESLKSGSHYGNGGITQIPRSVSGRVMKPRIAQVQLVGQMAVTSSQWPPPTEANVWK